MSKLRASEAHLLELRKIHSMLHSAMDALIKDLNANEAARLLILLDDRLTSLINTADVERDPDAASSETKASPMAVKPPPAPSKEAPPAAVVPVTEPAARTDRPSPSWRQPPPPPPAPTVAPVEPVLPGPTDAGKAEEPSAIPSEPILAVPPAPEPPPAHQGPMPSFEEMIASAAKANLATPEPSIAEPLPTIEAAPEAPAELSTSAEPAKLDDEPPVAAVADLPPASDEDNPEPREDEPEWIEEDLEDGADLREEREAAEAKQGLAGRLLSRFRLPGLGRRPAVAAAEPEPFANANESADLFPDDEEEEIDEAAVPLPETAPVPDPKIGRLHTAADQLASGQLLDEAAQRTGNRIELRKVALGLDLVVKGLPKPLGTVRIAETDGHVLYQPGFGLDLPNREPNRADLEIWMKAMGDVVVRVLEDIGRRRKGSGAPDSGEAS